MRSNRYLMHHGIKGQKWGIRRFQNPDGTYTAEGKAARRVDEPSRLEKKRNKQEERYNQAKNAEMQYGEKYLKAKGKRDKYVRKLNAAENGIRAKLYGPNGRKIRKLDKKLSKAEDKFQRASSQYEAAKDFTLRQNIKLSKLNDKVNREREKQAKRLIKEQLKELKMLEDLDEQYAT